MSKDDFVINVKVIVSVFGTVLLLALTIIINSWVKSEHEFKESVIDELQNIKVEIKKINSETSRLEFHQESLKEKCRDFGIDIKNIKYTLYDNGLKVRTDAN